MSFADGRELEEAWDFDSSRSDMPYGKCVFSMIQRDAIRIKTSRGNVSRAFKSDMVVVDGEIGDERAASAVVQYTWDRQWPGTVQFDYEVQ